MIENTFYDILDGISEYIYEIITQFRLFFFGLGVEDSEAQPYIWFFFLTVPIIFAALEVLFDFVLPTMFDLRHF